MKEIRYDDLKCSDDAHREFHFSKTKREPEILEIKGELVATQGGDENIIDGFYFDTNMIVPQGIDTAKGNKSNFIVSFIFTSTFPYAQRP